MNTMSDDVRLTKQEIDINTMSGDVFLTECEGDVNTMSGNIYLKKHYGNHVNSMSGDVNIEDSRVSHISTMSGDITVCRCMCRRIESLSGDVTLTKTSVNHVQCSELFGENSEIMTLTITDDTPYIKSVGSTGFKWWNPFTWFNNDFIQIQKCGSNSISYQCNGSITINNNKVYENGKCITKSDKPRKFYIPDTIRVDKIIFENGRTDNIVQSKRKPMVENGTWQKV